MIQWFEVPELLVENNTANALLPGKIGFVNVKHKPVHAGSWWRELLTKLGILRRQWQVTYEFEVQP